MLFSLSGQNDQGIAIFVYLKVRLNYIILSYMNLFTGLMGGPNVAHQRPGPTRINFFK